MSDSGYVEMKKLDALFTATVLSIPNKELQKHLAPYIEEYKWILINQYLTEAITAVRKQATVEYMEGKE